MKSTTIFESTPKKDIVAEVAMLTKLPKTEVEDVLNAFTDVCTKEIVTKGVLKWPGLILITRKEQCDVYRYQKDIDKTLKYDKTYHLRAKVPNIIKKLHREYFRSKLAKENNLSLEDWWKAVYYCDGKKEDNN